MGLLQDHQSAGLFPAAFDTGAQGHAIIGVSLGFPHIQLAAPLLAATSRRYCLTQVAILVTADGAVGTPIATTVNVHRHNALLLTPSTGEPADIGQVASGNVPRASVRLEDAAAPLGSLGTIVVSLPIVPVIPIGAVVGPFTGANAPMIYPVFFMGDFDGNDHLTFVPNDPVLGMQVCFWWSEARRNT